MRQRVVVGYGAANSSGTVVFGTADCEFSDSDPLSEAILALHIDDGHLAWVYRPDHARSRL